MGLGSSATRVGHLELVQFGYESGTMQLNQVRGRRGCENNLVSVQQKNFVQVDSTNNKISSANSNLSFRWVIIRFFWTLFHTMNPPLFLGYFLWSCKYENVFIIIKLKNFIFFRNKIRIFKKFACITFLCEVYIQPMLKTSHFTFYKLRYTFENSSQSWWC